MQYNFDEVVERENTASFKYDMRDRIFKNGDVIPMWVADMDFKTPPFVLDAIRNRLEHEILGYTFIPPSFAASVAGWISRRHQWDINPGWITFSPGVVPALNLLVLAFTQPGDKVIVQPPVYFPFFSAVTNHKRILVRNPLGYENGRYFIDFDALESCIDSRTKMLFLCSPHNPTGNVWSRQDLERIATLCLKHNILLISDEIHSDLIFRPHRHIPTASISEEISCNTITCMSASKTFNLAGLSTAYLVIQNPALRKRYNEVLDHIHVGAGNIFGFVATEAAYHFGDQWLEQLMHYLQGNLDFLQDFLHRHVPEIQVVPPQATYLTWLNCKGLGMSQQELNDFLIQKARLGLSDGAIFGTEGQGFQRINIGCRHDTLHEALLRLKEAIAKFMPNN